ARLGQCFQPCRYIDAVAEDIMLLGNHIPEVDPDAELDPFSRRGSPIAIGHAPLNVDCATDRADDAGELGQEPVSGLLDDPAMVFGDLRVNQFPEVPPQPLVRALLIRPHQPRITRHVGGEDGSEAADRGHTRRVRLTLSRVPQKPEADSIAQSAGSWTEPTRPLT